MYTEIHHTSKKFTQLQLQLVGIYTEVPKVESMRRQRRGYLQDMVELNFEAPES